MDERCRREIEELHAFFEGWFRGELAADAATFERCSEVLAGGFELIAPSGELTGRDELVERLRAAHGSRPESAGPFRIWTSKAECRPLGTGLMLATYEEWQETADGTRSRISTALFRERDDCPCGLEWLHVHETWRPGAG